MMWIALAPVNCKWDIGTYITSKLKLIHSIIVQWIACLALASSTFMHKFCTVYLRDGRTLQFFECLIVFKNGSVVFRLEMACNDSGFTHDSLIVGVFLTKTALCRYECSFIIVKIIELVL